MDNHESILLNTVHYSKHDMENLTDGEILELIFWTMDTYAGPDYAKLDIIKVILRMSKTDQT